MKKNEIKIGDRLYHGIFGWCKVTHPPLDDKTLVDLEADEIDYFVVGKGRVHFKREANGRHTLFTPNTDLFRGEEDVANAPDAYALRKLCYSAELTFWTEEEKAKHLDIDSALHNEIDKQRVEWQKQKEADEFDRIERGGSSIKPRHKHATNYTPPKKRRK